MFIEQWIWIWTEIAIKVNLKADNRLTDKHKNELNIVDNNYIKKLTN